MTALMMKSKVFLMLILLIAGVKTEINPADRCLEMLDFEGKLGSIIKLEQEEQLDIICTNVSGFFDCLNKVLKDGTTFDLREIAEILKGSDPGKGPAILKPAEELVKDICMDGSQLRTDYRMNEQCFQSIHNRSMEICENNAIGLYNKFIDTHRNRTPEQKRTDQYCVFIAYHVGCLGFLVKEQCGGQAFDIYKNIVWTIGFFKCGIRSSNFEQVLKIPYKSRAHYILSR